MLFVWPMGVLLGIVAFAAVCQLFAIKRYLKELVELQRGAVGAAAPNPEAASWPVGYPRTQV